jgi:phage terminase large subunit
MAEIVLPNNWLPRLYQMPFWRAMEGGCKRAIPIWHRRAGKDDAVLHWTAAAAHERRGVYWHMLPQANQARKAVWDAINTHTGLKRIDEAFPLDLRSSTRKHDMAIDLKCGSMWQLVGSDNFNSLVGSPPVGIVFSEWALADPAAWAYLSPILEENGGWAVFITTPRGKNHAYRMLQNARKNPQAWFSEVLTIDDTGILTPERYEAIRRDRIAEFGEVFGDAMCEQEYRCSFDAAVLGAYFSKEMADADRDGRICDVMADPSQPVHTAWDLGVDDSTAIWFFQVLAGGLNIIDYYESSGVGAEHYVDVLKERAYPYGKHFVPHDAKVKEWGSGRTRVETLQGLKLNPQLVPDHSFADGIQAARTTIPKCRFDADRCERGVDALRSYHAEYNEETRVLAKLAKHDWASHGADAFRYMAMAWRELRAAEPPPKSTSNVYIGLPDGTIQSNLTFAEMVAQRTRRRKEQE